jgi:hypothetical protein
MEIEGRASTGSARTVRALRESVAGIQLLSRFPLLLEKLEGGAFP